MRELVLISANGAEAVSLAEFKLWLRLEIDDEDDLLQSLITGARQWAEKYCGRSFTPGEQWQLTLDSFPRAFCGDDDIYGAVALRELFADPSEWIAGRTREYGIELAKGPVTAITAVTYIDSTGTQQTLTSSSYNLVQGGDDDAILYPLYSTGWPATQSRPGAVVVSFTAGAVPAETVKIAIKMIAAGWYGGRNEKDEVPNTALSLLSPFRVLKV